MIALHHLVFGRKYGIEFNIPVAGVTNHTIIFSTRTSNLSVNWGDGNVQNYTTGKYIDFTQTSNSSSYTLNHVYSSAFTGNIKLTGSADDIYSLQLVVVQSFTTTQDLYNILNFETFISQFTSLYSLVIGDKVTRSFDTQQKAKLKGDLSKIPNSVERFQIGNCFCFENASTDLYVNLSNFSPTSLLRYFYKGAFVGAGTDNPPTNIYGDLSKIPPLINFFKLENNVANALTYTAGRTWASSFDTLDLGNASLSATETDNLFNDMANSITTAIGSKIIRLVNCFRTSASNPAVAYLQSLGFTITVLGTAAHANSKILDLPLQNSFTDTTGFNTMIAGGTSNLPTFTLDGSEYYADFNGSQSIKTNGSLIINNDKVSISFWMKTNQNNSYSAYITELSTNTDSNNSFFVLNEPSLLICRNKNQGYNGKYIAKSASIFRHYVIIFNRSESATNEVKIYVDGVLQNATQYGAVDNSGSFGNYPLFIGQRGGTGTNGFIGQIKFFKIFNYPLSTTEITNLFNKTM